MPTLPTPTGLNSSFRTITNEYLPSNDSLSKAYQSSRSKVSDPSVILGYINVPSVENVSAVFNYNFYVQNERIENPSAIYDNASLAKFPRYAVIKWDFSGLSEYDSAAPFTPLPSGATLEANKDKIIEEDNIYDVGFINHTFSNIDAIEQGASDLENYSRISRSNQESVFGMATNQVSQDLNSNTGDPTNDRYFSSLLEDYTRLSDFPKTALGLKVFDENKKLNDEDDFVRSVTNSISLSVKINKSVIPDIFEESSVKSKNLQDLKISSSNRFFRVSGDRIFISPAYNNSGSPRVRGGVKVMGYVVDKYRSTVDGLVKEDTIYIEDPNQKRIIDKKILFGASYVYSVKSVFAVDVLSYSPDGNGVQISTLFVSARPVSSPLECYDDVPPPEPNDIKFSFDQKAGNLIIHWDTPVNHQKDIKQFQVFRRKSIKEPFELIAQYGFDTTKEGPGAERYKTGEVVDSNNYKNMPENLKYLVHNQDPNLVQGYPVYMHVDEDFTVDKEFYVSSAYIYAICSIDAHGLISNYSSQHYVTFDPYRNRLISKVVCDAGSPRQYPNMNLRIDTFKDVIKAEGDASRQLTVYFSPEYFKVKDERNIQYKIIEPGTASSYYLFQMINLDNQKSQVLKINIKDPQNLTS